MNTQNFVFGSTLITLVCIFETLVAEKLDDSSCGIANQPRIVGGTSVEYYKYQWFAQLIYGPEQLPICGGTLISSNHILTAAHCFEGNETLPEDIYKIVLGVYDNCDPESDEVRTVFRIKSVVIHQDYNDNDNANDIAIIFLRRPASKFKPVCLPSINAPLPQYSTIIGFGQYAFNNATKVCKLQEARVRVFSSTECRSFKKPFNDFKLQGAICAGLPEGGVDSCLGDSGGPLVANQNNRYTIRGIVSYGYSCAEKGWPGVYTNVAFYLDWINNYVSFNDYEQSPKV